MVMRSPRKAVVDGERKGCMSTLLFYRKFAFGIIVVVALTVSYLATNSALVGRDVTRSLEIEEKVKEKPPSASQAAAEDSDDTEGDDGDTGGKAKRTSGLPVDAVSTSTRVSTVHFIGERHTGTNWMYDHLSDCFGHGIEMRNDFSRWKHWFQWNTDRDGKIKEDVLVIAQFRNIYDWVEAMREFPYHAPLHQHLDWRSFVTKPWTMPRWGPDVRMTNTTGRCCMDRFHYNEVIPCAKELYDTTKFRPHYELYNDGSGRAYSSLVDMRADKIRNFMSVKDFDRVKEFVYVRYEDLVEQGTSSFLKQISDLTGIKPRCEASGPRPVSHKKVSNEYIQWMNEHADWSAENLIGYEKWTAESSSVPPSKTTDKKPRKKKAESIVAQK